ncbi:MAG: cytochrome P450 [Sphingomonadaceae bacterium]|nr:cytochrome P450 [Sphingomonadaceae bacterium]
MAQGSESGCPAMPAIVTNSSKFYRDPDSALPDGSRPALAKSEYGTEFLSYPLVRQTFRDKRLEARNYEYFEALGASEIILEFIREGNLNFMAPDKHDRIRAIVVKAFTSSRVDDFRPRMRGIADDLIDGFAKDGEADLVADFAHTYPISVIAQFVGIPASAVPSISDATVQLRMLGQKPFEPGMPILEKALSYLYEFIEQLVAERRATAPQEDFLGALIALQDAGEKLSHKELVWAVVFLMLGGHDTTRYTLAGCLVSILEADLWEGLFENPQTIPDVIEESMRLRPGTPRLMRIVVEPVELGEHKLETGDIVSLNLLAAGRDPATFSEPDAFRCPRSDPGYDIGFGFGRHVCIGQPLAKAEMAEAIGVLTRRLTDVKLNGDYGLKPTGVIAGYEAVPLRFSERES